MTRTKLGLLTIGQAPRADALADDVQAVLGDAAEVVERGALDGLTFDEVAALAPGEADDLLVTLLADGTPVRLGKRAILERLQAQVKRLEEEDGARATLLMCTGYFPDFRHRRPLLQPQAALYGVVKGIAADDRIGAMPPVPDQVAMARREWRAMGVEDPVIVTADPYGPDPLRRIADAAREAREQGARVLFMDCFGYDLRMRDAAAAEFPGPIVLARSMAARLVAEIVR